MLSNVLFPAPDGPIIAVSSPDRKWPLTFLRISFSSETNKKTILFFCFKLFCANLSSQTVFFSAEMRRFYCRKDVWFLDEIYLCLMNILLTSIVNFYFLCKHHILKICEYETESTNPKSVVLFETWLTLTIWMFLRTIQELNNCDMSYRYYCLHYHLLNT